MNKTTIINELLGINESYKAPDRRSTFDFDWQDEIAAEWELNLNTNHCGRGDDGGMG